MKTHNLKKTQHSINLRKLIKPAALCISALFIISILSVFSLTAVQAATTPAFGNTAIGTYKDQNDPNAQSISYFKATTTGSVTDIVAYISGASSGKASAALYAVNGNSASTLLAQSNSVNIGTTFSWVDFQLSTSYTVTSGTTYGLAIMGNVPVNLALVTGTGQRTGGPGYGSYANGFANPFGTIWFNDFIGAMSIYATGTSSSTPTQTPTPTPTPTITPTPTPTPIPTPFPYTGTNLIPSDPNTWMDNPSGSASQYMHIDNSVLYNGQPTVRLDTSFEDRGRECDITWITISPGDHVYYSVMVKTGSGVTNNYPWTGARIGMDIFGTNQYNHVDGVPRDYGYFDGDYRSSDYSGFLINNMHTYADYIGNQVLPSISSTNSNPSVSTFQVGWGADWTLLQWDFIVPTNTYYNIDTGASGQINGCIPIVDCLNPTMAPSIWIADLRIYVNSPT